MYYKAAAIQGAPLFYWEGPSSLSAEIYDAVAAADMDPLAVKLQYRHEKVAAANIGRQQM